MTLVSTVNVGVGGAASIEFTGIPQTGQDLVVVLSARVAGGAGDSAFMYLQFNGSTAVQYSSRYLDGDGATAISGTSTNQDSMFALRVNANGSTANTFGNSNLYIANYAGSTNKSLSVDAISENNASAAHQMITAGIWANTAAIASWKISTMGLYNFVQYSTASLYTISTTGATGATVA